MRHRARSRRLPLGLAAALFALAAAARPAQADCQVPEVVRPLPRAAAPDQLLLFLNMGTAVRLDGAAPWKLQCEASFSATGTPLPADEMVLTPNGTLVAAHFSGLLVSHDHACTYTAAAGLSLQQAGPSTVILDPRDPDRQMWITVYDTLYRSEDAGASATAVHKFTGQVLAGGGAAAPSDGRVLYLVSFSAGDGGLQRAFQVTRDGGASWEATRSPFGADEIQIAAVAPDDPQRLWLRRRPPDGDEIHLSVDGGKTASLVHRARTVDLQPSDRQALFTLGPAPGELWIAEKGDDATRRPDTTSSPALFHSQDGGVTWAQVPGRQPHFRCLVAQGPRLWACGNNRAAVSGDDFAVGASDDGGVTWTPRFSWGDLCDSVSCVSGPCDGALHGTGTTCYPGLCAGAGGDGGGADGGSGGTGGGADAGPTTPAPGSGCCRASGTGSPPASALVLLAVGLSAAALRRRR